MSTGPSYSRLTFYLIYPWENDFFQRDDERRTQRIASGAGGGLSENVKSVRRFINEQTSKFIELEQYFGIYDSGKWDIPTDFIKPAKMWAEHKTIQQIGGTCVEHR